MNKEISFKVSDVFGHRVSGQVPQYLEVNYRNWIFNPNQGKTLTILSNIKKLVEFTLPKYMNDSAIQSEVKSTSMDEELFLIVLYLLIINPELGKQLLDYELKKDKWYLFRVKTADGTLSTVHVLWLDVEWTCIAREFDGNGLWSEGNVFLSFATNKK